MYTEAITETSGGNLCFKLPFVKVYEEPTWSHKI